MKSEQIKHSLSVGTKSIQSRVFDRETDEVISFVKIPIEDSGLVRCEKGTRMNNEPVAIRYDFDGYGYKYMDSGSGSDWQTRAEGEFLYTHPVKELTDEDRSMLIRTLKWSEDLLRIVGHDEAVSDVQDCIMLLRKAQEK